MACSSRDPGTVTDDVVKYWQSERSAHEWAVRGPGAAATGMVRGYVGYEEWPNAPMIRREIARNGLAMILAFGDRLDVCDGTEGPVRSLGAFVIGNQSGASLTRVGGHQRGIQVELTCAGALSLFGEVSELTDVAVPIDDVLGRWGSDLVEQLGNAACWKQRFVILDRALAGRQGRDQVTPEVMWLRRQLAASGGQARVEPLMDETGWSRRVVTERFRRQVGVSPKAYARVLRFTRAVALLNAVCTGRTLADVAVECGYYDQSHFTRDFVGLAGCTPTEYMAESSGDRAVSFLQDEDVAALLP
jgi:AraC-like DNA-binding protein